MADRYAQHVSGLESPAAHGFAITPHDINDLAEVTRAVFIGGAGSLTAIMASGTTVTFQGLPAGTLLPIRSSRILATGTTATSLVGLC